jgi:hypothetical protein
MSKSDKFDLFEMCKRCTKGSKQYLQQNIKTSIEEYYCSTYKTYINEFSQAEIRCNKFEKKHD